MKQFKLPRKKKKKYKKDNIVFNSDWKQPYRVVNWEWFYNKRRVLARNLFQACGYKTYDFENLRDNHNLYKWQELNQLAK